MFKPIKTQEIEKGFYAIRTLFVNMYIYSTKEGLIIFDTGISKQIVKHSFKKLGLDINNVRAVFLTHSDFDHTGALKLFKNKKIYISKKEEPLITGKKARRLIMYNKRIQDVIYLEDQEEVFIGEDKIKLISSPGHTIGSAMYEINHDILIGGDTISISSKQKIGNFSMIQNMNHTQNKKTVQDFNKKKYFKDLSIIATGHYGILKKEK